MKNANMPLRSLAPEELALSYSKYYFWEQPQASFLQRQIMKNELDPKVGLTIENINDLLLPGYRDDESGWCHMPDGTNVVSYFTDMPGCTIEMIDWWFVWHFVGPNKALVPEGNGNLRYKIWNPRCHWDTGHHTEESRKFALDESISIRERRYGSRNFITENMAPDNQYSFGESSGYCFSPEKYGVDMKKLGDCTMITATHPSPTGGSVVVYHYRPRPEGGGIEWRARMWIGCYFDGEKFIKTKQEKASYESLVTMWEHAVGENQKLAYMLPSLYAEEGFKPVDAY